MPCRFASSGTVATSRSASRAILALNVASNFLRDLVISVLHPLRQSRTLHTLTFGPIFGVHFTIPSPLPLIIQDYRPLDEARGFFVPSMLFAPFRPRTLHVMGFGPVLPDRTTPKRGQKI